MIGLASSFCPIRLPHNPRVATRTRKTSLNARRRRFVLLLKPVLCALLLAMVSSVTAQYAETNHLVGLHFYADQNSTGGVAAAPIYTDVEKLLGDSGGPADSTNFAGDGGGWLIDVAVTDVNDAGAPFYQWAWQGGVFGATDKTQPGYIGYAVRRASQGGKKHTPLLRLQPAYGRNVPYEPARFGLPGTADPYTVLNFASDCRLVANLMRNDCKYYVIGNEINIQGENNRFTNNDGQDHYTTDWQPTPEQYADTYIAVRDTMSTAAIGAAGTPVCLMEPPSPGAVSGPTRIDGLETLWRQIKYANSMNPTKVDGFALHAYAEPGGADSGNIGFFNSLREQISIIAQLSHAGKPIFVTEFNKDMPDVANQNIGVSFVKRAYDTIYSWNTTTTGTIPGAGNPNIIGTNWFQYPPSDNSQPASYVFNRYSLLYWKDRIASPNANNDIWYAFQQIAKGQTTSTLTPFRYPAGKTGLATSWPANQQWWRDDFNVGPVDAQPPLPDWILTQSNGGTASISGGKMTFLGNSNQFGGCDIRTNDGYVFGDFTFLAKFTVTNANRTRPDISGAEANFDIQTRHRPGHSGYSLTFFTNGSADRPNHVVLRRTEVWTTVGAFDAVVTGGINSGDSFDAQFTEDGGALTIKVYKNGGASPVVNWTVNDSSFILGYVRLQSYGLNQVDIDSVAMGGKQWNFQQAAVGDWALFE